MNPNECITKHSLDSAPFYPGIGGGGGFSDFSQNESRFVFNIKPGLEWLTRYFIKDDFQIN